MDRPTNPDRDNALARYDSIWDDYFDSLEGRGIEFEEFGASLQEAHELKERLRKTGAVFRNGEASIVKGGLSPACVACTGPGGSRTFYLSLACHRNCYFCFNPNQQDYDHYLTHDYPWEEELEDFARQAGTSACVGLTGGEPLLRPDETVRFFERCQVFLPSAHTRLYTAGDLLDEDLLRRLAAARLSEIRLSVKLDDPPAARERVRANILLAKQYVPAVMVETPCIPGTYDEMCEVLLFLEETGASGINLLEFCYPFHNWDEFAKRGFKIKNPPFPVLFEYGYAGSLPVAGSEVLALRLMAFAFEKNLNLDIHYCSLENKHRSEIRQMNERRFANDSLFWLDPEDFFLKAAKVYGDDREPTATMLQRAGCPERIEDEEERSLLFPVRYMPELSGSPVQPVISYNVLVAKEQGQGIREVELEPFGDDA